MVYSELYGCQKQMFIYRCAPTGCTCLIVIQKALHPSVVGVLTNLSKSLSPYHDILRSAL